MTGITKLKAGRIFLDGKRQRNPFCEGARADCGSSAATFTADFAFKAREIVAMGRHPFLKRMQSETERDYQIIDEALSQTGTLHLRDRKNYTAFRRGAATDCYLRRAGAAPKLLILDEPTNHLDIQYTLEIMELMRKLNREQGITVFAVLCMISIWRQDFPTV